MMCFSTISEDNSFLTNKYINDGFLINEIANILKSHPRTISLILHANGISKDYIRSRAQIKIGDTWFNVDVTQASEEIRKGECSGQIFMSDDAFFGEYRKVVFNKGKVSNGESIETEAIIGGHERAIDNNSKKCNTYFPPYIITMLLRDAKKYQNDYKANGRNLWSIKNNDYRQRW